MRLLALSLLLMLCSATGLAQAEHPVAAQLSALQIIERNPAEWSRSEPDAWKDWESSVEPPEELQPYLLRAIDAYRRGNLPSSLSALYELLEVAPEYPPAMHQSGVIYFRLRRYGDAITAFERYLSVAPQRVADTRALGHCYYTLGDYEKALAHYAKVLGLEPDSVEALRGKGLAQMRLGESDAALTTLARVLELEPSHANAQTWVAQILYDEERVEEALVAAQHARDLDPYEPRAWFLLSQIHYDLGEDDEGDAAHARFSELNQIAQEIRAAEARLLYDPRQPAVYAALIDLNQRAGNSARVQHWMVRWIQTAPRDIDLRIRALDLAEEMKDSEGAAACASALEMLANDSISAWQRLAKYYAVTRNRLKQVDAEEQVARLRAGRTGGKQ